MDPQNIVDVHYNGKMEKNQMLKIVYTCAHALHRP